MGQANLILFSRGNLIPSKFEFELLHKEVPGFLKGEGKSIVDHVFQQISQMENNLDAISNHLNLSFEKTTNHRRPAAVEEDKPLDVNTKILPVKEKIEKIVKKATTVLHYKEVEERVFAEYGSLYEQNLPVKPLKTEELKFSFPSGLDSYAFNVRAYLSECLELFDNNKFFSCDENFKYLWLELSIPNTAKQEKQSIAIKKQMRVKIKI
jgi:hypothetical protein